MFALNLGHGWRVESPLNEQGEAEYLTLFIEEEFVGVTIIRKDGSQMPEEIRHNPQLHGFLLGLVAAKYLFFSGSETLAQYCVFRERDDGDFGDYVLRPADITPEERTAAIASLPEEIRMKIHEAAKEEVPTNVRQPT